MDELFDCPGCSGVGAIPGWACCGAASPQGCCGEPQPTQERCSWCEGLGRIGSRRLIERAALDGDMRALAEHEARLMLREAFPSPESSRAQRL